MAHTPEKEFRAIVTQILGRFKVEPSAIDRVCVAYAESWRMYHATPHPRWMLHTAARLPLSLEDRYLLCLLIIYHDVWYKVGREPGENERRSADWAVHDLRFYPGDQDWLFALVYQGIGATIKHTLEGVEPRFHDIVSILLDLDLWGLGQPRASFQEDTEKVWQEFLPRLTREEFDAGRSSWAATFLKRPRIYHTPRFAHLEEQARQNLRELAG